MIVPKRSRFEAEAVEPEKAVNQNHCPGSDVKAKVVKPSLFGTPTRQCQVCGAIEESVEPTFIHQRPSKRRPQSRSFGERVEGAAMGRGQKAVRGGGKKVGRTGRRWLKKLT